MRRVSWALVFIFVVVGITLAQSDGVKKKRPLPPDYGKVIINNYSEAAGLSAVVFDHWLHRAKFTCRLCHVDVGFAMKAGATGIKATDNMNGYYCGACHNGKMISEDRVVFDSCSKRTGQDTRMCERCHSSGKNVKKDYEFSKFTDKFPKGRFGNGIDWEKTEAEGLVKPVDFLQGISIKRPSLTIQKDFALGSKQEGMPDIIFSHKKHTIWSGCELCHPEIFVGVKRGSTKYSMVEIFEGRYCGVCHSTVAFPLIDCQRCHIKPVS
ncbi:MAG: c(7)-type cytochrome triheme domain-containing protein [Thermodesulfovibrionales bacterium]|jgi:c(7)-type cytochrome triheme protein